MMIPLIKATHPTLCNEINQPEVTSCFEILPTHSTSGVVPIYPSAITLAPNNSSHIAEVSLYSNECMRTKCFLATETTSFLAKMLSIIS